MTAANSAPQKRIMSEKVIHNRKKMIEVKVPCSILERTIPMAETLAI
jgi:hypothetical protein